MGTLTIQWRAGRRVGGKSQGQMGRERREDGDAGWTGGQDGFIAGEGPEGQ